MIYKRVLMNADRKPELFIDDGQSYTLFRKWGEDEYFVATTLEFEKHYDSDLFKTFEFFVVKEFNLWNATEAKSGLLIHGQRTTRKQLLSDVLECGSRIEKFVDKWKPDPHFIDNNRTIEEYRKETLKY